MYGIGCHFFLRSSLAYCWSRINIPEQADLCYDNSTCCFPIFIDLLVSFFCSYLRKVTSESAFDSTLRIIFTGYQIRRMAVDNGILLIIDIKCAKIFIEVRIKLVQTYISGSSCGRSSSFSQLTGWLCLWQNSEETSWTHRCPRSCSRAWSNPQRGLANLYQGRSGRWNHSDSRHAQYQPSPHWSGRLQSHR